MDNGHYPEFCHSLEAGRSNTGLHTTDKLSISIMKEFPFRTFMGRSVWDLGDWARGELARVNGLPDFDGVDLPGFPGHR